MRAPTLLALVAGLVAGGVAQAAPVAAYPYQDFSTAPVMVTLGTATFTLTFPGAAPTDVTQSADAVQTGGTGMVNTSMGAINAYGLGSTIGPDTTPEFTAFPTAVLIPYSTADDFIGVSYAAMDGTHYGFIEVNGSLLVSDAVESLPNTDITTVPEPAGLALLGAGLLGLVAVRRRA